ncbi:MAG TPA: SPFH domain-containing protein [Candidatus Babeliales bacterium]|nr:SPFH domain-containing protein [Candidatus Babeliales bacterium]
MFEFTSLIYTYLGLAIVGFFALIFLIRSFYLIQQSQAIVIERLGSFDRVLGPGLHFVMPFIEQPRAALWTYVRPIDAHGRYQRILQQFERIDLREAVYDFPKQNVITKDNVTMEINALLYYQITDPKAAMYEVSNLPEAIEKLTQTTLRNVIGAMDLDHTLASRDEINSKLRVILDEATDKWGIKINRVELQEVNPPADIRHAMEKQMRAERDRRAVILEAEGKKHAEILDAEGQRQSDILRSEGTAQARVIAAESEAIARLKIAEAEAQAISKLRESLPKNIDPQAYLIAMGYLKVLPELTKAGAGKLVVVPYEASGLMGSLATIKAVFEAEKAE